MLRTLTRLSPLLLLTACGGGGDPLPPATGTLESSGFHSVMPPGQKGVFNAAETLAAQAGQYAAHTRDQYDLFKALLADNGVPGLRDDQLAQYFKPSPLLPAAGDVAREYRPGQRADVRVLRDRGAGVPYVIGDTREGTLFGVGYTTAEDRLFVMDVLRHVGRARMSEFLGPSSANIAMDRAQIAIAPYRDADLTAQMEALRTRGGRHAQAHADFVAYAAGVNQFIREARMDPSKLPAEYPALQLVPEDWRLEDTVAIAALVGGVFGKGGGNELRNACALAAMTEALGSAAAARAAFDDMVMEDDPETPVTAAGRFPYMTDLGPANPAAHPAIDCASLTPIDTGAPDVNAALEAITGQRFNLGRNVASTPLGPLPLNLPTSLSNGLLVTGARTRSGRPVAVMGPQVSFFIPQLFVEKAVIGPGIAARGVGFPGTDIYIQIGRGRDYAWSATSSRADVIDHWVLKLCEPDGGAATVDSMGYLHRGQCKPIEAFEHLQVAKPSAGGRPDAGSQLVIRFPVERSADYGPLLARGRLKDGTPIAIASQRSTYFRELESIPGFQKIVDPDFMRRGAAGFQEAFGSDLEYSFNWLYVDRRDTAYIHGCRCPLRAPGKDPYLPAWGTGEYDWRGFLPQAGQPQALNPASGYVSSWNNKPAHGFGAGDDNFAWGPNFRSHFFDREIAAAFADGPVTRGRVVDAVQVPATIDWRAQQLVPLLARVMGSAPASTGDARLPDMLARLRAWEQDGGHRRDRDGDGAYEHAQAVAIMDAWWFKLIARVFEARTGGFFALTGYGLHQAPQLGQGFAFGFGPYTHFHKDLRQVLGEPVTGPLSRTYCGNGDRAACRGELWATLGDAALELETQFGSGAVEDWRRAAADDFIRFSAVGVTTVPPIPFQNRPTYQQVVEVGAPD